MHPPDRRPGQDVVELLEQDELPKLAEPRVRIVGTGPHRGRSAPQLRLAQQMLAAPVALLGLRLRRVRPTVQLQVQLADPHGRVRVVGFGLGEERCRCLDLDAG
jgi:hypothetical protein